MTPEEAALTKACVLYLMTQHVPASSPVPLPHFSVFEVYADWLEDHDRGEEAEKFRKLKGMLYLGWQEKNIQKTIAGHDFKRNSVITFRFLDGIRFDKPIGTDAAIVMSEEANTGNIKLRVEVRL